MTTISLIASIVAVLTALYGLWHQHRELRQRDLELEQRDIELKQRDREFRERMDLERKEFFEKYASQETRMRNWLDGLSEPPASLPEDDHMDTGLPYQAGAPVRTLELFYGRQEQLSSVMNCINGSQMASMCILGARRSGKTSFFYYLNNIFNPDQYPSIVPVFLDAQTAITSDKNFYAYMHREASAVLNVRSRANCHPPEIAREIEFDVLAGFLEQASKKGWRFIFFLDEFEKLVHDRQISGEDFFGSLRSLILKGNVSWITASFRPVNMPGTNTSPFSNIIQDTCYLGPLSRVDARLLVSEPAARAGHPFEREDVDLILDLAGRMPFMLQKASLLLYKAHRSGNLGQAARMHLTNVLKLEAKHYFDSQLFNLSSAEKKALFLLCLQKNIDDHLSVLCLLEEYGLVDRNTEGFQILGKSFEEYIYQPAKEALAAGKLLTTSLSSS